MKQYNLVSTSGKKHPGKTRGLLMICIGIALLGLLCGCGRAQERGPEGLAPRSVSDSDKEVSAEEAEPLPDDTAADAEGTIAEAQAETAEEDEMRNQYREILLRLKDDGILSDLMTERLDPEFEASYAITDVDADGRKELVISYYGGSMSSMVAAVYGYDLENKKVYLELTEFPAVTFYDNGYAVALASHNHSLGDAEWPYTVYRYDEEVGVYQWAGYVETWEKAYFETNYSGEPFPDELDTDGDGILYYIVNDEKENDYSIERYRYNASDYTEWRASLLGGAKEIPVEYVDLLKEGVPE